MSYNLNTHKADFVDIATFCNNNQFSVVWGVSTIGEVTGTGGIPTRLLDETSSKLSKEGVRMFMDARFSDGWNWKPEESALEKADRMQKKSQNLKQKQYEVSKLKLEIFEEEHPDKVSHLSPEYLKLRYDEAQARASIYSK
jgi:hypothetical protein